MNVLEEYDYFSKQRIAHLETLEGEKKIDNERRRAKARAQALQWREEGKAALSSVMINVHNLKYMLQPHNKLRESTKLIEEYCSISETYNFYKLRLSTGQKIIKLINKDKNPFKYQSKTNLIEWKRAVLQQLLQCYREKHPQLEVCTFPGQSSRRYQDINSTRRLMRIYGSYIPIDIKTRKALRKKRDELKRANAKWDMIQRTMAACEFIGHCKSIQHNNSKGCSNCGVIYLGSTLNGAIPYVKSVSRDTGVATLVTLEFELQTLKDEEAAQEIVLQRVNQELDAMEDVILSLVRINMQNFWCYVLQYKRSKRIYRRLQRSKFYYRIRRLVVMKREIDRRVLERAVIEVDEYRDKYFDVIAELSEYIDCQNRRKRERMLTFARRFHKTLQRIVEEAKERRYKEWLRLQSMPPPVKPIVIKTLESNPAIERFACYRLECNGRHFLTQERFDIHMKTHYQDDCKRKQQVAANEQQRRQREGKELALLTTIENAKDYMSQHHQHQQQQQQIDNGRTLIAGNFRSDIHIDDDSALDQLLSDINSTTSSLTLASTNNRELRTPSRDIRAVSSNNNAEDSVHTLQHSNSLVFPPTVHDQQTHTLSSPLSVSMHTLPTTAPFSPNNQLASSSKNKLLSSAGKMLFNSSFSNDDTMPRTHDLGAKMYQTVRVNFSKFMIVELELISKHPGTVAPAKFIVQSEVTKLGSDSALCDCVIGSSRTGLVSPVHCMVYRVESASEGAKVKIVDNKSLHGTYLVNSKSASSSVGSMALRVSNILGSASYLEDGTLICLAVASNNKGNSNNMLPASEASAAVVVYRVQIK